jgi:hypothetical protein
MATNIPYSTALDCYFGNVSVPAEYLYSDTMQCTTPPFPTPGPVSVTVNPRSESLLTRQVEEQQEEWLLSDDGDDVSSNATFLYYGKT